METEREKLVRKQAYIQRVLKIQARGGSTIGFGKMVAEGGWLGADLFRHALLIVGIVALVAIGAGIATDCRPYQVGLYWILSIVWPNR